MGVDIPKPQNTEVQQEQPKVAPVERTDVQRVQEAARKLAEASRNNPEQSKELARRAGEVLKQFSADMKGIDSAISDGQRDALSNLQNVASDLDVTGQKLEHQVTKVAETVANKLQDGSMSMSDASVILAFAMNQEQVDAAMRDALSSTGKGLVKRGANGPENQPNS